MHADTFLGKEASLAKSVLDPTSLDKARDPEDTKTEEFCFEFQACSTFKLKDLLPKFTNCLNMLLLAAQHTFRASKNMTI